MTTHKIFLCTALSLSICTLAGCKSNSAPPADANTAPASHVAATPKVQFNPCSVLTSAEVSAITTDKVASAEDMGDDCHYHSTSDSGEDNAVIGIYLTGGKDQVGYRHQANALVGGLAGSVQGLADVGKSAKSAGGPAVAASAPALGDEAFWESNDVLAVRKGDMFIEVTPPIVHDRGTRLIPSMISNANKRAIAQKLAEAVLAKLAH